MRQFSNCGAFAATAAAPLFVKKRRPAVPGPNPTKSTKPHNKLLFLSTPSPRCSILAGAPMAKSRSMCGLPVARAFGVLVNFFALWFLGRLASAFPKFAAFFLGSVAAICRILFQLTGASAPPPPPTYENKRI